MSRSVCVFFGGNDVEEEDMIVEWLLCAVAAASVAVAVMRDGIVFSGVGSLELLPRNV